MCPIFCEPGASGLPIYLTVVFTVVFGILLVLNSLGCFFGARWKKRQGQTGSRGHLFIHGHESISSISFCHLSCPSSHDDSEPWCNCQLSLTLISPSISFCLSDLSPLLVLVLFTSPICNIHPSKLSPLCFFHIFCLICWLFFLLLLQLVSFYLFYSSPLYLWFFIRHISSLALFIAEQFWCLWVDAPLFKF